MRASLHLLAALSVLVAGWPARAAERSRMAKLAVVDLRTTGNINPKDVEALSALIAAEAGHYSVKVVAGSDLRTLIGFDKQRQLLGCSEGSCLAEIGGALGVDYLLSSEVGQIGGRWLLSATLLDVAKATGLQRASRAAKSQDGLVDLVPTVVAEAFSGILVAKEPAPPVAVANAEERGGTRRIAGYSLVGLGGALLAGGGVAGFLAYRQHAAAADLAGPAPTQDEYDTAKAGIANKARIADGLYAAGVIAAGVGLALALTAPSDAEPPASLSLVPLAGGGALVLGGGF